MKLMLKIAGGIVIAVVLLTVGCAAVIGAGLSSSTSEGITKSQFKAVPMGASRAEVEDLLGKPDDDQEMNIDTVGFGKLHDECIYYNTVDSSLDFNMYQFCFSNGKLESKNRY